MARTAVAVSRVWPQSCLVLCLLGLLLTTANAAAPNDDAQTGVIDGVVRFTGTLPPATTITTSDGSTLTHHDLVVEPKSKGLRDVVAILEDAPAQPPVKDAHPVVMDQVDWVFMPRVVVVQHGRPIRFDNSDAVNHSVMAISRVKENQLNSIAAPGMPLSHTFKPQTRPILIGCSLHPWMRAWVYVVEHPWFAVSDDEGKFQIERVPPGKYKLLLVHSDSKLREQRSVEVKAGQTVNVRVEWPQTE